jgi:hypothetical protein
MKGNKSEFEELVRRAQKKATAPLADKQAKCDGGGGEAKDLRKRDLQERKCFN